MHTFNDARNFDYDYETGDEGAPRVPEAGELHDIGRCQPPPSWNGVPGDTWLCHECSQLFECAVVVAGEKAWDPLGRPDVFEPVQPPKTTCRCLVPSPYETLEGTTFRCPECRQWLRLEVVSYGIGFAHEWRAWRKPSRLFEQ
jgi:hypothetical protein